MLQLLLRLLARPPAAPAAAERRRRRKEEKKKKSGRSEVQFLHSAAADGRFSECCASARLRTAAWFRWLPLPDCCLEEDGSSGLT